MKKKILSTLVLLALIITSFAGTNTNYANSEEADSRLVTVIVEMKDKPLLASSISKKLSASSYLNMASTVEKKETLLEQQENTLEKINDSIGEDTNYIFQYTNVLNGFAIKVKKSDLTKIRRLSEVKSVTEATKIELHDTQADPNDGLLDCCQDINIGKIHEMGYTGKNQVIGIIDSEFDTNHDVFSLSPPNPKYTKDDIQKIADEKNLSPTVPVKRLYHSEKIPYAYNYVNKSSSTDADKSTPIHGTHVAGIAAGHGGKAPDGTTYKGVAMDAQLMLCAVPDLNSAGIVAAIDDLSKFDVDVINCSWGTPYSAISSSITTAISNARNAGILVDVSAGNSGLGYASSNILSSLPDYATSGNPGSLDDVLSVASSEASNIQLFLNKFTFDNGTEANYSDQGIPDSFSKAFSGKEFEYVDCGYASVDEVKNLDLTGKVAVAKRGSKDPNKTLTIVEKYNNVTKKGALGMFLILTDDNLSPGFTIDTGSLVASISKTTGEKMLNAKKKLFRTTGETAYEKVKNDNPIISTFSSWATTNDLTLKPDITAPGGKIISSVPDDKFALKNGTSMAAPHMSGCTALFTQFLDENDLGLDTKATRNTYFENAIMSTAKILYQNEKEKIPFSPRKQGAGLVNMEAALKTPVVLNNLNEKTKINLGENLTDKFSLVFYAKNYSDNDVTYTVDASALVNKFEKVDSEYYTTVDMEKLPLKIEALNQTSTNTITIKAHTKMRLCLDVSIDSATLEDYKKVYTNGYFVDGFVYLTSKNKAIPDLNIPYTGFYGDWEDQPIFDKGYYDKDSIRRETYLASGEKCEETKPESEQEEHCKCSILGNNPYYDNETYDKEEYGGISPNGDDAHDFLCVNIVPLRDCDSTELSIKDKNNNVVYSRKIDISKGLVADIDISYETLKSFEEGDYTAFISSKYLTDDTKSDELNLKFYIDKSAPAIKDINFTNTNNKKTLTVTFSDNRYLMGCTLKGKTKENKSYQKTNEIPATSTATTSFDITRLDENTINLSVLDYARNKTKLDYNALYELYRLKEIEKKYNLLSSKQAVNNNAANKTSTTITLQRPTIKKITAKKKTITVYWKKLKTNISGYELQYSKKKSFKSSKKRTIKKASTTKLKIKGLKKKKKYYIRIRAYHKNGKTKIYSKWSKVKSKKI